MNNTNQKIRAKAPLRLGIAGGGTDVSPYSDQYGGCVLNATINLYAHTYIETNSDNSLCEFRAEDIKKIDFMDLDKDIHISGDLILHRAVYKRIMDEFNDGKYLPLKITTFCDCPPGSGLGSSSAVVVSMIQAFKELLSLPLGEYDLASLAYEIERIDCGLNGGKQDQYAATFGGFNFIEFYNENKVIVNPLRIRNHIINELEASLILFYVGASRDSANIINDQINSINKNSNSLDAMHDVKLNAYKIKEYLLKADLKSVSDIFSASWEAKKRTSKSITNQTIDNIEKEIMSSGANSMKVSGAGGGGFIMIFADPEKN